MLCFFTTGNSKRTILDIFPLPDESSLKMNTVDHIPQTLASHIRLTKESWPRGPEGGPVIQHGADMLKPDPRDTFYSSKAVTLRLAHSDFFAIFFSLINCLPHSRHPFSCFQTFISLISPALFHFLFPHVFFLCFKHLFTYNVYTHIYVFSGI